MSYEFKNLNEVPAQDTLTENTTVMAFESGSPRQIPASEFGGKGLMVDLRSYTISGDPFTIEDMNYDPIYEAITAGQHVVIQLQLEGADVFAIILAASIQPGTGFNVMLHNLRITFTNGSYHTTA